MVGKHILGLGEDIFEKCGRNDAQRNFAINAAEGQIVDLIAEGWNVGALGGIDLDRQHVLAVEIEMGCQLEGKRRVPALVLAEACAVEPHRGSGHHAFKVHKHALPAGFGWKLEMAPVDGNEFVVLIVEAVPGQADIGVRNHHPLETGIVEVAGFGSGRERCGDKANSG